MLKIEFELGLLIIDWFGLELFRGPTTHLAYTPFPWDPLRDCTGVIGEPAVQVTVAARVRGVVLLLCSSASRPDS